MYHFCSSTFQSELFFQNDSVSLARCLTANNICWLMTTQLESQSREHLTNIIITGLLSLTCLASCLPEIKMWRNTITLIFSSSHLLIVPRSHLEWDQAVVGHRGEGVRQRHVERGGLRHERPLPCHHRPEAESILRRELVVTLQHYVQCQCRVSRPTNQINI